MKTKTEISIEASTDDWQFGWWNSDLEDFIPFTDTEKGQAEAALALGISRELVEALQLSAGDLKNMIRDDLVDIWKRLDQIEERLAQ